MSFLRIFRGSAKETTGQNNDANQLQATQEKLASFFMAMSPKISAAKSNYTLEMPDAQAITFLITTRSSENAQFAQAVGLETDLWTSHTLQANPDGTVNSVTMSAGIEEWAIRKFNLNAEEAIAALKQEIEGAIAPHEHDSALDDLKRQDLAAQSSSSQTGISPELPGRNVA